MSALGRAEAAVGLLLLAVLGAGGGCTPQPPFDPQARGRAILEACAGDATCVRERWRRDPRNWNLGLRAEVAGRAPTDPLVVATTREIVAPDLSALPCEPHPATGGGVVFFRTSVGRKKSATFPLASFRWERYEEALVGHRRVVAAAADARGDEESLWKRVRSVPALDRACLRFRGKRDRCRVGDPP